MRSITLSRPKSRTVCGYELKRMPIGAYLDAMQLLEELPGELSAKLFDGLDLRAMAARMKSADRGWLAELAAKALTVAPEMALGVIAKLTQIPYARLRDDPEIGAEGLMRIVTAWAEVNEIENFTKAASELMAKIKALAGRTAGSNS